MKISKTTFIASENAAFDHIRDSISQQLTSFNYGLLPPAPGEATSLDLKVSIDVDRNIKAQLLTCRAVTEAGVRIEITGQSAEHINIPQKNLEGSFNPGQNDSRTLEVFLTIDPYNRVAVGEPDPSENPPRHPYTSPSFKIEILPEGELNRKEHWPYHFLLAEIDLQGDEFKVSKNHIPACTSARSHPALLDAYYDLGNLLDSLGINAVKIIQKIKSRGQGDSLAKNILEVAERAVYFLAGNMSSYRLIIAEQPPVYMIAHFIQLAHLVKTCLSCMPVSEKEELANYYSDWTAFSQGTFEKILEDTISMEYDHRQIGSAIKKIRVFADTMADLFQKLADLDYIGKSKSQVDQNANLLVEEDTEHSKKKGWF